MTRENLCSQQELIFRSNNIKGFAERKRQIIFAFRSLFDVDVFRLADEQTIAVLLILSDRMAPFNTFAHVLHRLSM